MRAPQLFVVLMSMLLLAFAAEVPVPRGSWRMELFAEHPRINHPSVVACAPDGRVFAAEDPMDITLPGSAAQGRILCFHPDGHATVFASGLYAVFGMQYLEGKLYVLHNPKFSVFKDAQGIGTERVDLIEQTNPNPWALDWNDHVPANFRLAMDGRFYVAVGDKGLFGARGRDGKVLNMRGGGVVRLRPDGTGLEIFSRGVRNILDVAITAEDELFTYDNTDENQWMGRFTHMVDGGFYGYPFDFIPQRPYTLWMTADFGAGAATGALAINDDALPEDYRGNILLADFGQRNVRRVQLAREGGTFRVAADEQIFANSPGDFRPVGIAFSDDGKSLFICDWQHRDTKEKAEAGRLWKMTWTGPSNPKPRPGWYLPAAMGEKFDAAPRELAEALTHPARSVRLCAQRQLAVLGSQAIPALSNLLTQASAPSIARAHALWALDAIDHGVTVRSAILKAATEGDALLARQAIRELGERGVSAAAGPLVELLKNPDASLRFHAATALGRIGAIEAILPLLELGAETDRFVRFSAFTALNRIGRAHPESWERILAGLRRSNARVREATGFAVRETYDSVLVQALTAHVQSAADSSVRLAGLSALAPLGYRVPEWNGEWWAYHPFRLAPPAKTEPWAGTDVALATLRKALSDDSPEVRGFAAQSIGQTKLRDAGALLAVRFEQERNLGVQKSLLTALTRLKDPAGAALVASWLEQGEDHQLEREMLELAKAAPTPELTAGLRRLIASRPNHKLAPAAAEILGALEDRASAPLLLRAVQSPSPALRLAAAKSFSILASSNDTPALVMLLKDAHDDIALNAARALARLKATNAAPALLEAAKRPALRADATRALTRMPLPSALDLYLEGMGSSDPQLRLESRDALAAISHAVLLDLSSRLENLPKPVIRGLQRIYRDEPGAERVGIFAIAAPSPPPAAYLAFALGHPGNAQRGEKIFKDEGSVGCIRCHRVKGEGMDIGPDLSGVGAQFDRRALAENVLFPDKAVREGYNVSELELNTGEQLSGMIRAETAESISIQPALGPTRTIPKTEIKTRRATTTSLMPEGLESGLSLEDFADLLTYLETLRSGA